SQTIAKRSDWHPFSRVLFSCVGSHEWLSARVSQKSVYRFDVAKQCQNRINVTLSKRVTEKSYFVGLLLVSNRLVGSPYRLVAIQRRRPHIYGVKYSALYFTWKLLRNRLKKRKLFSVYVAKASC